MSAILSICVVLRKFQNIQIIKEKVLWQIEFSTISKLSPVRFTVIHDIQLGLLNPMMNYFKQSVNDNKGKAIHEGIISASPIVQYAALCVITAVLPELTVKDRAYIAKGLNIASSRELSRDHIQETALSIGRHIDKAFGMIGAISQSYIPDISASRTIVSQAIEEHLNESIYFYTKSEYLFHCQALLANTEEILDCFGPLDQYYTMVDHSLSYLEEPSLRKWTTWLLQQTKDSYYTALIPIVKFSLEFLVALLPGVFSVLSNAEEYLISYISDLFKYASAGHKRLMLKILRQEEAQWIWEKLEIAQKLDVLVELRELPSALQLLECSIRDRLDSQNTRCLSSNVEDEEFCYLYKIYHLLQEYKYIEAIPHEYSLSNGLVNAIQDLFQKGLFLSLRNELITSINEKDEILMIGASWRIGKICILNKSVDKEVVIASLLNEWDSKNLKDMISKQRKKSIKYSKIRSAEYPQAYDHILLQHAIENILLAKREEFDLIEERNLLIQNTFECKEFILRVNLAISRLLKSEKIVGSFRFLIKIAIAHRHFEYAQNLIYEMRLLHHDLESSYFMYYHYKLAIDYKKQIGVKDRIREFLMTLEPPEFKWKCFVIYIKSYFIDNTSLSWDEFLHEENDFLQDSDQCLDQIRYSLEKIYYIIGDSLDTYTIDINLPQSLESTILSALCYAKSVEYGHSYSKISLTRAFSIFFQLPQSGRTDRITDQMNALDQQILNIARLAPLSSLIDRLQQVLSHSKRENSLHQLDHSRQISSHSSRERQICQDVILTILTRLWAKHPAQISWYAFSFYKAASSEKAVKLVKTAYKGISKLLPDKIIKKIKYNETIIDELIMLSKQKTDALKKKINFTKGYLAIPNSANFTSINYPKHYELYGQDYSALPDDPTLIASLSTQIEIIHSKARPKKIYFIDNHGSSHTFLCKHENEKVDMRKEARMLNIIRCAGETLETDPLTSTLSIRLPSYFIIALSPRCAIIEWINNTNTLKNIILAYWQDHGIQLSLKQLSPLISKYKDGFYNEEAWADIILPKQFPQFHQFFYETFPEPNI